MKRLGFGLLIVGCLVLAAVTFLFVAAPTDFVRDWAIEEVKARTGRELSVNGGVSLKVFPSLAVSLHDVVVSDPPVMTKGSAQPPFFKAESIELVIPLGPLLSRNLKIDRLILKQPVLSLRIDAAGRRNWDFKSPDHLPNKRADGGRVRLASLIDRDPIAAPRSDILHGDHVPGGLSPVGLSPVGLSRVAAEEIAIGTGSLESLEDIKLDDLRIEGGAVSYTDQASKANEQVTGIDARVHMSDLSSPFELTSKFVWRTQSVTLDGRVAAPRELLAGDQSPVKLEGKAAPLQAKFDGAVTIASVSKLSGALELRANSARDAARWLQLTVPSPTGFGPLSLTGRIVGTTGEPVAIASVSGATLSLDGMTARGDFEVSSGQERPLVRASMTLDKLDMNRYRGGAGGPPSAAKEGTKPSAGAAGASQPEKSIDDLIGEATPAGAGAAPGPRSGNGARPQVRGWSNAPFETAALGLVDAEVNVRLGPLTVGEVVITRSRVDLRLAAKRLTAALKDILLYDGQGTGDIAINAAGAAPVVKARFDLSGVEARPLLVAVAGLDRLAGKAKIDVDVTGEGSHQQEILDSLSGSAHLAFSDGAIVGVNLPGIVRAVQKGQFSGAQAVETEKTDFSELTGSFAIASGLAQTKDLKLLSPLLRVTGNGTIDLAHQLLDLTTRPKIVGSLAGQGGPLGLSGIEIPVLVQGPWDRPKVNVNLAGVLKNPEQIQKGVQQIGEALKGKSPKDVENALRGLLGGKPADPSQPDSKPANPKALLDQLLKR